jgi:cytochrome c
MEKGLDAVTHNAIAGTGGMPPKGGNMDLTDDQVKQIVEFMVNNSSSH